MIKVIKVSVTLSTPDCRSIFYRVRGVSILCAAVTTLQTRSNDRRNQPCNRIYVQFIQLFCGFFCWLCARVSSTLEVRLTTPFCGFYGGRLVGSGLGGKLPRWSLFLMILSLWFCVVFSLQARVYRRFGIFFWIIRSICAGWWGAAGAVGGGRRCRRGGWGGRPGGGGRLRGGIWSRRAGGRAGRWFPWGRS